MGLPIIDKIAGDERGAAIWRRVTRSAAELANTTPSCTLHYSYPEAAGCPVHMDRKQGFVVDFLHEFPFDLGSKFLEKSSLS
jgi:hypothetical protein